MTPLFTQMLDVRWREMDALGHVNNAQFLSYVEETRVQWFRAMNSDWQDQNCSPVVAAIHVDFRKPIHWPERLRVELFASRRGGKSVTVGHRISSAGGPNIVYAEGHTVLVWIDRAGQTVNLPGHIAGLFPD